MALKTPWWGKPLIWAGKGLVWLTNLVSGGAITRATEAYKEGKKVDEAIVDVDESIVEANDQKAYELSRSYKEADLQAKQTEQQVRSDNTQSKNSAGDQFQAESAALAASGSSGITEGSPYMAVESSINETGRQLDEWFRGSLEGKGMSGDRTAMMLESSRYGQRRIDDGIGDLEDYKGELKEQRADLWSKTIGTQFWADLTGGILKTGAGLYTAVGGSEGLAKIGSFMEGGSWSDLIPKSPVSFGTSVAEMNNMSVPRQNFSSSNLAPGFMTSGQKFSAFASPMADGVAVGAKNAAGFLGSIPGIMGIPSAPDYGNMFNVMVGKTRTSPMTFGMKLPDPSGSNFGLTMLMSKLNKGAY